MLVATGLCTEHASHSRSTALRRLIRASLVAWIFCNLAGCTDDPACDQCRRFDAVDWCTNEGRGQCSSTNGGLACTVDASAADSCMPVQFEISTTPQSVSIPASVTGLEVVLFDLRSTGAGRIAAAEMTGAAQFSIAFDGALVSCTRGSYNDGANLYLRCPASADLGSVVFTCTQTTVAFSLSVMFAESTCDYPSWCVART